MQQALRYIRQPKLTLVATFLPYECQSRHHLILQLFFVYVDVVEGHEDPLELLLGDAVEEDGEFVGAVEEVQAEVVGGGWAPAEDVDELEEGDYRGVRDVADVVVVQE